MKDQLDAIIKTLTMVCETEIAFIKLSAGDYSSLDLNVGLPKPLSPLSFTFLNGLIHEHGSDGIFEVADISKDPLFIGTPFLASHPSIRFVSGVPICTEDSLPLGILCVMDITPRELTDTQRATFSQLAVTAQKLIANDKVFDVIGVPNVSDSHLNEHRFRTLCELSPLGIFSTDADGSCTYTNPRWHEIYDLTLEESLGDGWQSGLHPEDKAHIFEVWSANAALNLEFDFEFRTRHKDGSICFVRSRAKPFNDTLGNLAGFIGTVADISEQKRVHQKNEILLDALRAQFIMSFTDTSGNIIEVNDAFCRISQYSREELIGQDHSIVNSKTHSKNYFLDMWQTIRKGESWRGEICNRAKDGTLYWVDSVIAPLVNAEGKVERYISIRSDISVRKEQEHELLKHRALIDRTGKVAGVGGWEFDFSTGSLYWSDETCRIHGVEPGYVPQIDEAVNFYAPEARPVIREALDTAMKTGENWDLELPFIQLNGNNIWVRAVGSVEFEDGAPVRALGAFQDITERVNQQVAIEEAHTRMSLATTSGKIGIWEYDIKLNSLIWDDWMYRLYGLSPKNKTEVYELWAMHLHPDDKEAAEKAIADAIAGVAEFDTEFRVVWEDKSVHYIRGTARLTYDAHGAPEKMIGVNWDVSDLRKASEELSAQHELLEVTLESIGDAVITTDAQGNTRWLNPVAQQLTGWANEEAVGRPLSQVFNIINEDTRLRTENPVDTCLTQGKVVGLANHTVLISRDGHEYGIEDSASPIRNASGEILGAVLVFHDVTEQRRLSNEVSYQATHDALTGLVNRLEFETRLRRLLHQAGQDKVVHALLYIDLDQFKIVNDTSGHSVGDEVLQRVSKLFDEVIRKRDTLARLGGDEFGVILEHCSGEQALRVAQEICNNMESFRFLHDTHRFRIGASVGLVTIDDQWSTAAALMQAADTSCYAAKDAGRNRVHVWSDSDLAIRTRHGEMQWTTRIESALDDNRFELYAQRITSLKDESLEIHAEVLVRMKDEDGSIILPDTFFPAAERFHLASRIDRRVLRNTVDWLMSQPKDTVIGIKMLCINLSGQSIGDRSFHRYAIDILNKLDANACAKICIEITETAAITNLVDAVLFIEQINNLGVLVALDDFGAGASSFGYLKNLTVDILKIDGQFIRNLIDDPLDEAAVRCFVEVAKLVNLQTVAEYVDRPEILARVKELGIDYAQGFLLHKPEPIDIAIGNGECLVASMN